MKELKPLAHTRKTLGESGDSLVVGGSIAYVTSEGQLTKPWGKSERPRPRWLKGEAIGGAIEAIRRDDGATLDAIELDSAVINNGLAVAGGCLYAVCEDGTVRCFR